MMATMDRTDCDDALDAILEYCEGIVGRSARLAKALLLLDSNEEDLKPHEKRLLDDAWAKVKADAAQRQWEEMGRG